MSCATCIKPNVWRFVTSVKYKIIVCNVFAITAFIKAIAAKNRPRLINKFFLVAPIFRAKGILSLTVINPKIPQYT